MSPKREPDLSDWIDDLAVALDRLVNDPSRWRAALDQGAPVDFAAALQSAGDDERAALVAARKVVIRTFLREGGDPCALSDPDDSPVWHTLHAVAAAAAGDATRELRDRWGTVIPSGLPRVQAARRQRAVEQAIASRRPGETISQVLSRAGVSRGHGYRVMSRKHGQ
jgi:hypothetical protein